jgi:hypothetical protein
VPAPYPLLRNRQSIFKVTEHHYSSFLGAIMQFNFLTRRKIRVFRRGAMDCAHIQKPHPFVGYALPTSLGGGSGKVFNIS